METMRSVLVIFTLEMWVKLSSAPSALTLVNGHSAANGNTSGFNIFLNGVVGGGNGYIGSMPASLDTRWGSVPANTWFHYAYVRQNQNARAFINGVPSTQASGSQNATILDNTNYTSQNFKIGFPLVGTWPGDSQDVLPVSHSRKVRFIQAIFLQIYLTQPLEPCLQTLLSF